MRLTYKYEKSNGYGSVKLKNLPNDPFADKMTYLDNVWKEQRNKLGQLEDIEEELGIDLITLFKAVKKVYFKVNGEIKISRCPVIYILEKRIEPKEELSFKLKDYGKTWALTKEELL